MTVDCEIGESVSVAASGYFNHLCLYCCCLCKSWQIFPFPLELKTESALVRPLSISLVTCAKRGAEQLDFNSSSRLATASCRLPREDSQFLVSLWIRIDVQCRILFISVWREGESEPGAESDLILRPLKTILVSVELVVIKVIRITKCILLQFAQFLKQMYAAGVIRCGGVVGK